MEKWKTIEKGHLIFNVSNQGKVQVLGSPRGKVVKHLSSINQFSENGGHPGKRYLTTHGYLVHHLVAEAWIAPIPEGYTVNHKDLNKFNNHVENLEIITRSDNLKHAWKNGVYDNVKIPSHEIERRKHIKKTKKLNRQWHIYDTNFNLLGRYESKESAAKSLGVTRQAAHQSFLNAYPMLKNYFICRPTQLEDLQERYQEKHQEETINA